MGLRCPECGGVGHVSAYNPELGFARSAFKLWDCHACKGTGWRIPPALPKKVVQRRERMNP